MKHHHHQQRIDPRDVYHPEEAALGVVLAVAIGIALAVLLVAWWSA